MHIEGQDAILKEKENKKGSRFSKKSIRTCQIRDVYKNVLSGNAQETQDSRTPEK